jgi:hypothetical protein
MKENMVFFGNGCGHKHVFDIWYVGDQPVIERVLCGWGAV